MVPEFTVTTYGLLAILIAVVVRFAWDEVKPRKLPLTDEEKEKRRELLKHFTEPAGPKGVPILGYLPFLGRHSHIALTKLIPKYGEMYQIYMGTEKCVVINSPTMLKNAFTKETFSARPPMFVRDHIVKNRGLILTDGEKQRAHRRLALNKLTHLCLNKRTKATDRLNEHISRETREFIQYVMLEEGKPFDPSQLLSNNVGNIIMTIITGRRYEYEEPFFRECMKTIEEGFQLVEMSMIINFFPFLRKMPGINSGYAKICDNHVKTSGFFQKVVDHHKRTYDPNVTRDFIDGYLHELNNPKNAGTENLYSEQELLQNVVDVFSAGMETTKSTLRWAFLYMAANPKCQERVQQEIDHVLGCHSLQERLPTIDDLMSLPYTEACISEVHRIASVVPLGVPHSVKEDTIFEGKFIEKGAWVMPNLYAIHHDENNFHEPEKFKPERFITDKGHYRQIPNYYPFSIGRRACLGERLAKLEVFLIFASVMQNFNITMPDGEPVNKELFNGQIGVTYQPKPYQLCMRKRGVNFPYA